MDYSGPIWMINFCTLVSGFILALIPGTIPKNEGRFAFSIFSILAFLLFTVYFPFFGTTCLSGIFGQCSVCPHETLWTMVNRGTWPQFLGLIFIELFVWFVFIVSLIVGFTEEKT